jgi:hypothetical protein
LLSSSRSTTIPFGAPWKVFRYSCGTRRSSSRSAFTALKPNTLPMIDDVMFGIDPSSNRSSPYATYAMYWGGSVPGTGSTR